MDSVKHQRESRVDSAAATDLNRQAACLAP
jgi:hypothetical protein